VYFTEHDRRLTREELARRFPRLLDGLVANADIGFVMVATEREGTVVLGRDGVRYLADDRVDGVDPLADYPPTAAEHLRRSDRFRHVPDLLCNGRFDPATGEVPAFEELVGSHGGLGGTQAEPFLLAPADLPLPQAPIVGAEALHRAIKPWVQAAMRRGTIGLVALVPDEPAAAVARR
jgi:hypothetical protein